MFRGVSSTSSCDRVYRLKSTLRSCVFLLLAGGLPFFGSCGYRLGGVPCDSFLPVKSVGVPLFRNRSHEPLAEDLFTATFREGLRSLPCLALRPSEEADAVFRGTILRLEIFPVAVDPEFLVLEYGMRVTITLTLEKRGDGAILWESGPLVEEARFYASAVPADPSDPMLLQENRREALIQMSRRLSERVTERLLLGY
jgi:hypothetical protein